MTIEYAILGLLSWKPLSGYDLKKIISDSSIYYWSGNNNQIYKTLVQLHESGLVTQEIFNQKFLPARKEYAITDKGRAALHQWLVSPPELPELRHSFLIRLTWADPLTDDELDVLLVTYSEEIRVGCMVQREIMLRNTQPGRTQRETYLWRKISEHVVAIYQDELKWAEEICLDLKMMRQS